MSRKTMYSPEEVSLILKEASSRAREREELQYNRDVIAALHDLTHLPLPDLERAAKDVSESRSLDFFSVRQQLFLAGTFIMAAGLPLSAWWVLLSG
jgi:hypothetical protein